MAHEPKLSLTALLQRSPVEPQCCCYHSVLHVTIIIFVNVFTLYCKSKVITAMTVYTVHPLIPSPRTYIGVLWGMILSLHCNIKTVTSTGTCFVFCVFDLYKYIPPNAARVHPVGCQSGSTEFRTQRVESTADSGLCLVSSVCRGLPKAHLSYTQLFGLIRNGCLW